MSTTSSKYNRHADFKKNIEIICKLPRVNSWGQFVNPSSLRCVYLHSELEEAFLWLQTQVDVGNYVAGFISYEASAVFDDAYSVKSKVNFPLLWLASFEHEPNTFILPDTILDTVLPDDFIPELSREQYIEKVKKIKKYIYNGDIYQANLTLRAKSHIKISPRELYLYLVNSHPVPYSAYIDTGDIQLISLSPELFLDCDGEKIYSLPMKGTAKRALSADDDIAVANELAIDMKNRAENLMILDMVRNDLGKFCETGSINVDPIFRVDTYHTLHQMVSGVSGRCKNILIKDILKASFPPASITGAPKVRTMQIINELEKTPRKVYTGSIGCFTPDKKFCLNVAIRTIIFDSGICELGIGSGIVADSIAEKEWEESVLKSTFASFEIPDFKVIETMLWESGKGISFLQEHLNRAEKSQKYFLRNFHIQNIIDELNSITKTINTNYAIIRLLISKDASYKIELSKYSTPLLWGKEPLKIKLSKRRTDSSNVFYYHKTTERKLYNAQFANAKKDGFDEVIFINERNEITEGAISNIFLSINTNWYTPPISSGILSGIWRKNMIDNLNASEKKLNLNDLIVAEKILIGNSVRGTAEANFINIT